MPLSNYLASSRISQPGVCTSSTRPATPYEGQTIYETDTDKVLVWNGSAWYPNWNLPWGVVGKTKVTTNTTSSGNAFTTIATLSVTGIAGRLYKVSAHFYFQLGGSGYGVCQLLNGAVQIQEGTFDRTTSQYAQMSPFTYTEQVGTTTFSTRFTANVAGTHTIYGNASYPHVLIVEDVGPA